MKLKVFMVDFVPLKNKGEEAIVRGIEDLLSDNRKDEIEIALFDDVRNVERRDNLILFPKTWLFPVIIRRHHLLLRIMNDQIQRLTTIIKLHKIVKGHSSIKSAIIDQKGEKKIMSDFFKEADIILAGHDGVYFSTHSDLILWSKKFGKRVGAFGVGGRTHFEGTSSFANKVLQKAVDAADFFIVRENGVFNILRFKTQGTNLRLAPDPAFHMIPEKSTTVKGWIRNEAAELHSHLKTRDRLVIGVTVSHKRCIILKPFGKETNSFPEMIQKHEEYLADFFDNLCIQGNFMIVFLPHSLEKWPKNDVTASQNVVSLMKNKPNTIILENDISPRLLKGIMKECDFIIGERAHSLIGAASSSVPYCALTASNDTRTHDILGDMCELEDNMLDMDILTSKQAADKAIGLINNKDNIRKHLLVMNLKFAEELKESRRIILNK